MKRLLLILLGIFLGTGLTVYAAQPILSSFQTGAIPVKGSVLLTNGIDSTWVATSTLGIGSTASNITGLITAGTNISISGAGTGGSPYNISATGSGTNFFTNSGANTYLNTGSNLEAPTLTATSTTATSTFAGDVAIGSAGELPNPYLFIGTSTAHLPLYGRVQGDVIDAEYDYNGAASINIANANVGNCASVTFFADGNNPTLGGYYGTFSFLNDGWTGVGCSIGAGTAQLPEAVVIANPTGELDNVIASTTNDGAADFNWFTNTNTQVMKLTNAGNLGVGTTSPYALLSIGNTGGIGFTLATSTFNTTGGINIKNGCYAINGTCISGGSGTPGGLNTQVQYNNGGVFGGISGATTNGTIMSLTNALLGGATLTTSSVNGVTLTTAGSATTFLNGTGTYTTPSGGSSFGYPFPSNATSTLLTFSGGLSVANPFSLTSLAVGVLYAGTGGTVSRISTSTVSSGTGIGFSGSAGVLIGGSNLTISNTGVTSIVAGTNVTVSGATGAVTINSTATGVTGPGSSTNNDLAMFNGVTGQVIADAQVGTDGAGDLIGNQFNSIANFEIILASDIGPQNPSTNHTDLFSVSPSQASNLTLTLPTTAGSANQFLQTNGSGMLTWATGTGGSTLITAGTGISTSTSSGGAVLVTNTGVTSLTAGSGISLSGSTGAVTITGTGGGTNYFTSAGGVTFANKDPLVGAQAFEATSTTATSTFAGDVWIGSNGVLPNPDLRIGTSSVPLYGRVLGDVIDAEYDYNGAASINIANANVGNCAATTYFADGNNPTLGGYYGTTSFLNDGWTDGAGAGCGIGVSTTDKPEAYTFANPTGEEDFDIASTTNAGFADFNWNVNNATKMKLTNGGFLGIGTTSPSYLLSVATPNGMTTQQNLLFGISSSTAGVSTTTVLSLVNSSANGFTLTVGGAISNIGGGGTTNIQAAGVTKIAIASFITNFTSAANAAAVTGHYIFTGVADTGEAASTNSMVMNFNFNQLRTHVSGVVPINQDLLLQPTLQAFAAGTLAANAVIASSSSFVINGEPVIFGIGSETNAYGLFIGASTSPNTASTTNAYGAFIQGATSGTNNYALQTNGRDVMSGLTQSSGLQTAVACFSSTNELIFDTVACLASARRYKEDITDFPEQTALDQILALTPVNYIYKPDFNGALQSNPNYARLQLGLIADDAMKVNPAFGLVEVATTTFEGKTYAPGAPAAIDYNEVDAALVGAVKAEQAEIEAIKVPLTHDVQDDWQDIAIAILALWCLYLTFKKK